MWNHSTKQRRAAWRRRQDLDWTREYQGLIRYLPPVEIPPTAFLDSGTALAAWWHAGGARVQMVTRASLPGLFPTDD